MKWRLWRGGSGVADFDGFFKIGQVMWSAWRVLGVGRGLRRETRSRLTSRTLVEPPRLTTRIWGSHILSQFLRIALEDCSAEEWLLGSLVNSESRGWKSRKWKKWLHSATYIRIFWSIGCKTGAFFKKKKNTEKVAAQRSYKRIGKVTYLTKTLPKEKGGIFEVQNPTRMALGYKRDDVRDQHIK